MSPIYTYYICKPHNNSIHNSARKCVCVSSFLRNTVYTESIHGKLSTTAVKRLWTVFVLWQHRIMGQGDSARVFDPSESMENAGILDVFPIFHTARLGQKIRRSPQLPLCGVALIIRRAHPKADNTGSSPNPARSRGR